MTRTIDAALLTEQKKLAYTPSLLISFQDNNLPHPTLVKTPLTNYSGNPTASVTTTTAIVRAHRVSGVGIQTQKITAPAGGAANWESWTLVDSDGLYPTLFWTGTQVVLIYQAAAKAVKYRTSTDEGATWSAASTIWTPAYFLNNTQMGVSGGATRSGLVYATGTSLFFARYDQAGSHFHAAISHVFAGNVWASGALWLSGDTYRFAVIIKDYADWSDCAVLLQPLTYDGTTDTWGDPTTYIGIQSDEGAAPSYFFDYAHLAKVGSWYWLTYAYTASAADGALYDNNDTMIAVSDDCTFFTAGVRTGLLVADRLQPNTMGGVTYLSSDKHLLTSTPPATIQAATADVKALDILDLGPTAFAEINLANQAGAYDSIQTGRLGCDIVIERGAYCSGTAKRVTRETFCASAFARVLTGKAVRVHAYNYHKLLALWRAEIAYYYPTITLSALVETVAALAGIHAATFDEADLWATEIAEFTIPAGQTGAATLQALQDQFQFVSRMGAPYTLESMVLSAAPAADYVLGTAAGEHKTLILEDQANRTAPSITHAIITSTTAGAQSLAGAIQAEMGRQFTKRVDRHHLPTEADCAEVAANITTNANNSILRAMVVSLPAFHLQPYDVIQSDDWAADTRRYLVQLRETYNPASVATLPRRVKQVWRQTLDLANLARSPYKRPPTRPPFSPPTEEPVEEPWDPDRDIVEPWNHDFGPPPLESALVISYSPTTQRALVRFANQAAAVRIPIAHNVSPAVLTAGKKVAVARLDPTNPADALIVGPYGGTVDWSQFSKLYSSDGDTVALTADAAGALTTGGALTAAGLLTAQAGLNVTGNADVSGNNLTRGFFTFVNGGTLTIASGVVTATASFHILDTEGGAATDDLDTINGGSTGSLLLLRTTSSSRDVTLKDGTGNLNLVGDFVMSSSGCFVLLFRPNSSQWTEIARSSP